MNARQEEKELAESGNVSQAAVMWKKRTGANLEEAREMRRYFVKHFQKYWGLVLSYFFVLLFMGCNVGDNLPPLESSPDAGQVSIFHACEAGMECETNTCRDLDQEGTAQVCTVECLTHADCWEYNLNSFCICDFTEDMLCTVNVPGRPDTTRHCLLPCDPLAEVDACEEEGLSCEIVSFSIEPVSIRFACRPPYEET